MVSSKNRRISVETSEFTYACAAFCLLLLLETCIPRSSAAPAYRTSKDRKMDKESHDSNGFLNENLWENPCGYNKSAPRPVFAYTPELAKQVAVQAKSAYVVAEEFKDEFAERAHSYDSFIKLLDAWESYKWLQEYSWYREEVLPTEKVFSENVPDDYLSNFIKQDNTAQLDQILSVMYKGLKTIVASLDSMERFALSESYLSDLKKKVAFTKHKVRAVLCQFSDIMLSRKIPTEESRVDAADIPDFSGDQGAGKMVLVYRDTLKYLEYMAQVFDKMAEEGV